MTDIITVLNLEITHWENQLTILDMHPIRDAVARTKVLGAIEALQRVVKALSKEEMRA